MVMGWAETLAEFDIEVQHLPGKSNETRDSVSRSFDSWKSRQEQKDHGFPKLFFTKAAATQLLAIRAD